MRPRRPDACHELIPNRKSTWPKKRYPSRQRRACARSPYSERSRAMAALAAIVGLLDLMHHDVRHLAICTDRALRPESDARYPSILLHYADLLPAPRAFVVVFLRPATFSCPPAGSLWTLARSSLGRMAGRAVRRALYTVRDPPPRASAVRHQRLVSPAMRLQSVSRVSKCGADAK